MVAVAGGKLYLSAVVAEGTHLLFIYFSYLPLLFARRKDGRNRESSHDAEGYQIWGQCCLQTS